MARRLGGRRAGAPAVQWRPYLGAWCSGHWRCRPTGRRRPWAEESLPGLRTQARVFRPRASSRVESLRRVNPVTYTAARKSLTLRFPRRFCDLRRNACCSSTFKGFCSVSSYKAPGSVKRWLPKAAPFITQTSPLPSEGCTREIQNAGCTFRSPPLSSLLAVEPLWNRCKAPDELR